MTSQGDGGANEASDVGGRGTRIVAGTPILFDLDGTLTDPRQGIVGSIRYALRRLGRELPAEHELACHIGPPFGARAHGLTAMGALWGYGSTSELLEAGAQLLCPRFRELPALLESIA